LAGRWSSAITGVKVSFSHFKAASTCSGTAVIPGYSP
jgi:hypothetical protein